MSARERLPIRFLTKKFNLKNRAFLSKARFFLCINGKECLNNGEYTKKLHDDTKNNCAISQTLQDDSVQKADKTKQLSKNMT